jgi:hypothetical protein
MLHSCSWWLYATLCAQCIKLLAAGPKLLHCVVDCIPSIVVERLCVPRVV